LERYAANTCTYQEFNECIGYFEQAGGNEIIQEWLQEEWMLANGSTTGSSQWEHLYPLQRSGKVVRMNRWMKFAAAAVVAIGLSMAVYYFIIQSGKTTNQPAVAEQLKNDIPAPTGTHTILRLANGSEIVLDNARNGTLSREGNTSISKAADQVIYNSTAKNTGAILSNTLATAKGGKISIQLEDGTKVWLNALSTLKYPVTFSGEDRIVELTGEAYFEVATLRLRSGQKMPFKVKLVNGGEVEVLGTHFNINAYEDEPVIKTTLLEGKVKMSSMVNGEWSMLKPGEQVSLSQQSHLSQPIPVQTEEAIAWKNNLFWFENTDMQTVMRQVSRWYDVDIEFEDKIDRHITGTLPKNVSISTLLKVMEESGGIHFTINGKKVRVSR
jgi:ferric-dicitrate binding protein FerR (iron transport regulator)